MPDQFLHGVEVVRTDDGTSPVVTARSSIIGLVGTAPDAPDGFGFNEPQRVAGPRDAAILGKRGTLGKAYDAVYAQGADTVVMVRVPEGATDAETRALVAGNAVEGTGAAALDTARDRLDLVPRIVAAPGFTSPVEPTAPDPVVMALLSYAERARAIVVGDGPNTTEADAIAAAGAYGSDRVYLVDPHVKAADFETGEIGVRPASGYVAGLIARSDIRRGFWFSPSNQEILGIAGTARPIDFHVTRRDTEANRLNGAGVATIVRRGKFRLWGNRGLGTDATWAYLSVRRTADVIFASIEAAHAWAMDRPFSRQLLLDIRDSVDAFGQDLVARGALLGFEAWLDPELNTEAALKAGRVHLGFDFEPPAPLEHLTFRAYRTGAYRDELLAPLAPPVDVVPDGVLAASLLFGTDPVVMGDEPLVFGSS